VQTRSLAVAMANSPRAVPYVAPLWMLRVIMLNTALVFPLCALLIRMPLLLPHAQTLITSLATATWVFASKAGLRIALLLITIRTQPTLAVTAVLRALL
jgi:hypothetical protein